MSKKVYLAGSIEGVSEEWAKGWRAQASLRLGSQYLRVVDPTFFDGTLEGLSAAEIVTRDRYLLRAADCVLFDARKPGWGTAAELHDAWELGMPCVGWGFPEGKVPSAFLEYQATKLFVGLEEAVDYLVSLMSLVP